MGLFPSGSSMTSACRPTSCRSFRRYVTLKQAGTRYKGSARSIPEKTPSFSVDPDRGFFYCFGCRAGGDVFKFLELHEKMGFRMRFACWLRSSACPSLRRPTARLVDATLREGLLKAHEIAAGFFREQLPGATGARARRYLAERGIAPETVDQLGLGLAPAGPTALRKRLLDAGLTESLLIQSGLALRRENGRSSTGSAIG